MAEPPRAALRCLIVDDSARFLDAARGLLDGQDIATAVASTGDEAVRRAGELHPDVALVDIDLGAEDGFEVVRRLAEPGSGRPARLILISTYEESDFAELIARSPAVGFISKSELSADAIDALLRKADRRAGGPSMSRR
jgi:CheY-like chemotaxis protein